MMMYMRAMIILLDMYLPNQNIACFLLFFTIEEARKLQYWKYHANKNNPSKPLWGTGLFRYVSEIEGAQILRDAVAIKKGAEGEMLARDFYDYYCSICRLTHDDIGIPEGALTRRL